MERDKKQQSKIPEYALYRHQARVRYHKIINEWSYLASMYVYLFDAHGAREADGWMDGWRGYRDKSWKAKKKKKVSLFNRIERAGVQYAKIILLTSPGCVITGWREWLRFGSSSILGGDFYRYDQQWLSVGGLELFRLKGADDDSILVKRPKVTCSTKVAKKEEGDVR